MSGSPAVVMRLVASAHTVAEKAGAIVRKVLHSGDLGIVEKVGHSFCYFKSQKKYSYKLVPDTQDKLSAVEI